MTLSISTSALELHIDPGTGRLIGVFNQYNGLELIAPPVATPPFRLELNETGWVEQYRDFDYQQLEHGLRLSLQIEHDITLAVGIMTRDEDVLITISAMNRGKATIDRIENPIFCEPAARAAKGSYRRQTGDTRPATDRADRGLAPGCMIGRGSLFVERARNKTDAGFYDRRAPGDRA